MPLAFVQLLLTRTALLAPADLLAMFRCCRQLAELVAAHAPGGARLARPHNAPWPQALTDLLRRCAPWRDLEVVLLPPPTRRAASLTPLQPDDDAGSTTTQPLLPASVSAMVTSLRLRHVALTPAVLADSGLLGLPQSTPSHGQPSSGAPRWPALRSLDLDDCRFASAQGAAAFLEAGEAGATPYPLLRALRVSGAAAGGLPLWAQRWLVSLAASAGVGELQLRGEWRGASQLVDGMPGLHTVQWCALDAEEGGSGGGSAVVQLVEEQEGGAYSPHEEHGAVWRALLRHASLRHVELRGVDAQGDLRRCDGGGGAVWRTLTLERCGLQSLLRLPVWRCAETVVLRGEVDLVPGCLPLPPHYDYDDHGGNRQEADDAPVCVSELLWQLQRAGRLEVQPAPASPFSAAAWGLERRALFMVNATPDPNSAEQQTLPGVLAALAAARWRGEGGGALGLVLQHPTAELLAPLCEALALLGPRARTLCLCVDCWGWNRFLHGLLAALPPSCAHLMLHLPFGALVRPARGVLQSAPPSHALTVTVMDHFGRVTPEEESELRQARACCGDGGGEVTLRFHRRQQRACVAA